MQQARSPSPARAHGLRNRQVAGSAERWPLAGWRPEKSSGSSGAFGRRGHGVPSAMQARGQRSVTVTLPRQLPWISVMPSSERASAGTRDPMAIEPPMLVVAEAGFAARCVQRTVRTDQALRERRRRRSRVCPVPSDLSQTVIGTEPRTTLWVVRGTATIRRMMPAVQTRDAEIHDSESPVGCTHPQPSSSVCGVTSSRESRAKPTRLRVREGS